MSSKKITLEEVGINEDTTPKISINSLAPGSIVNYQTSTPPFQLSIDPTLAYGGTSYNNVSNRVGTYKDYRRESLLELLQRYPNEFKQMVADGVEFSVDELKDILEKGGTGTATVLLDSDIELPREISEIIIKKISVCSNSYIKKYIPRFMMSYNDILDLNFRMGTIIDFHMYIADPLITNTANDRVLYWVFKDPRFTEDRVVKCNEYVQRMYKKYKMFIKFSDYSRINPKKTFSAYDIQVDIDIFNGVFGEEDDNNEEVKD